MTHQASQSRIAILTGPPGVGKTTIILKLYEHYRTRGVAVAGMVTQEVREGGRRVGFKIRDLDSGREGWLAKTEGATGARIGKYNVDLHDLEGIGVEAIRNAIEGTSKLILVDEVGPMEMTSTAFRRSISRLFHINKPMVATVKYGSHYQEVEAELVGSAMFTITPYNRSQVIAQLIGHLDTWVGNRRD